MKKTTGRKKRCYPMGKYVYYNIMVLIKTILIRDKIAIIITTLCITIVPYTGSHKQFRSLTVVTPLF